MATDTTLDKFLTYGTHAARLAFVPVPPANILVEFYETDTGDVFVWYSGTWFQIGGTGSSGAGSVTVTLTDAQIKALPTTPITLVAAPGAGKLIWPSNIIVIAKTGAGAYTNLNPLNGYIAVTLNSSDVSNYIGNDNTIAGFTQLDDLLGSTGTNIQSFTSPFTDDAGALDDWGPTSYIINATTAANTPLAIYINNQGAGVLTGGNVANRLQVTVDYKTLTLP